jgi:hypothetical protein
MATSESRPTSPKDSLSHARHFSNRALDSLPEEIEVWAQPLWRLPMVTLDGGFVAKAIFSQLPLCHQNLGVD